MGQIPEHAPLGAAAVAVPLQSKARGRSEPAFCRGLEVVPAPTSSVQSRRTRPCTTSMTTPTKATTKARRRRPRSSRLHKRATPPRSRSRSWRPPTCTATSTTRTSACRARRRAGKAPAAEGPVVRDGQHPRARVVGGHCEDAPSVAPQPPPHRAAASFWLLFAGRPDQNVAEHRAAHRPVPALGRRRQPHRVQQRPLPTLHRPRAPRLAFARRQDPQLHNVVGEA